MCMRHGTCDKKTRNEAINFFIVLSSDTPPSTALHDSASTGAVTGQLGGSTGHLI